MKQKVIMIDPNTLIEGTLRKHLDTRGNTVLQVVRTEAELDKCLADRTNETAVIIFDPVLSSAFLSNNEGEIENAEKGGVGLIVLNKIKEKLGEDFKKIKLIFLTHTSYQRLREAGFTHEDLKDYSEKPQFAAVLMKKIFGE